MPPMPSDQISGLRVLSALRRNAYCAFPARCLDEPIVKLRIAGQILILSCAPEAIQHVMMTHAEHYARLPFGRRILGLIIGRGLALSEGEAWRRQRRAMAPAFTPRNVSTMARHIILCTDVALRHLEQSDGAKIDMLREMQMLSLEIAATSMFSIETSAFGSELRRWCRST
jgi:cytochrome P450